MDQRDETIQGAPGAAEEAGTSSAKDTAEIRLPGEIVEVYRRPPKRAEARERVFLYRRPLPQQLLPQKAVVLLSPPAPAAPAAAPRRQKRRGFRRFLAGFGALALLAGISFALERGPTPRMPQIPSPFRGEYDQPRENQEITIPAAPTGLGATLAVKGGHDRQMTAQEVYQQVNPSVVLVMAQLRSGASVGTGVIFTSDGYIVTNYHVLEGGEDCRVILDTGENYGAGYVGGDAESDLAVLKINQRELPSGRELPAAQFGDSDSLTVGDRVYAIGNPLGVELRGTLTDGIVSAIDRNVWVDDRTMTLIQTNAALNSGNSGGPLINEYGQVVGINVIKMTSDYSNVEGLGFAIPTASMERIVNDLLGWGELQPEPLLGVMVMQQSAELPDGRFGLQVAEVTPDSAADRAGVQTGDYVLRAAGEDLRTSRDLLRIRRRCYLGDRLPMTLWRDGQILEVTLELNDPVELEPEETPWYIG